MLFYWLSVLVNVMDIRKHTVSVTQDATVW